LEDFGYELQQISGELMRLGFVLVIVPIMALCACAQSPRALPQADGVSGERAMEFVRAQVAFGPRPPGSVQLQKCREFIERQLRSFGYQVEVIALATHYDTKLMEGMRFVGANDAGSSTGLLLELARVLAANDGSLDYWFLFLDGEEAFVEWTTFDSTYGSRHLAKRWREEGVAPRIRSLILMDMIGDKDLDIFYDTNSTPRLMKLVFDTAADIGLQDILSTIRAPIEDDHIAFIAVGIPSVDIIDLNYGPGNSYFHTPEDSLDKVSPDSMEKVGRLVLAVLAALQEKG
jgi:glutaminyl-peptide cyclotransferase